MCNHHSIREFFVSQFVHDVNIRTRSRLSWCVCWWSQFQRAASSNDEMRTHVIKKTSELFFPIFRTRRKNRTKETLYLSGHCEGRISCAICFLNIPSKVTFWSFIGKKPPPAIFYIISSSRLMEKTAWNEWNYENVIRDSHIPETFSKKECIWHLPPLAYNPGRLNGAL